MWSKVLLLKLVVVVLVTLSNSKNVRVENFELSIANPNSCEVIIAASRFDGDCCSMNTTQGNGCILNIVNGRCKVRPFVLFLWFQDVGHGVVPYRRNLRPGDFLNLCCDGCVSG